MLAKSGREVISNMGLNSSGFFSFDTLQSLLRDLTYLLLQHGKQWTTCLLRSIMILNFCWSLLCDSLKSLFNKISHCQFCSLLDRIYWGFNLFPMGCLNFKWSQCERPKFQKNLCSCLTKKWLYQLKFDVSTL